MLIIILRNPAKNISRRSAGVGHDMRCFLDVTTGKLRQVEEDCFASFVFQDGFHACLHSRECVQRMGASSTFAVLRVVRDSSGIIG